MANRDRSSRRWPILVGAGLFGLANFMMGTSPDDVQSNIAAWMDLLFGWQVPDWLANPRADSIGQVITITAALALLGWYLAPRVAAFVGGGASTGSIDDALDGGAKAKRAARRTRPVKGMSRLRKRARVAKRRAWRWMRFYLPWIEYEAQPIELPSIRGAHYGELRDNLAAFSIRLARAFPGTNDVVTEFTDTKQIIRRLNTMFRWPLQAVLGDYDNGDYRSALPFFWTTGEGNMHFRRYVQYKPRVVLIDHMEVTPSYMVVFWDRAMPWHNYIYLECAPRKPHKSVTFTTDTQYFGIYEGRVVGGNECEDRAFAVRGRPVEMAHEPDTRKRNLTREGLMLVPINSPANDPSNDRAVRSHIERMLDDRAHLPAFTEFLTSLPKRKRHEP